MIKSYAFLDFYNEYIRKEQQRHIKVYVGDYVKAIESEFDLTEQKNYQVLKINDIDMITIKNDKGVEDVYSVENFYSQLVFDSHKRQIDVDASWEW